MQTRNATRFGIGSALCCLVLVACSAPIGSKNRNAQAAPTSADPANATYAGIYNDPVTLTDGLYEGPPFEPGSPIRPRLELVKDLRVDADFDEDGATETAVLLTESSGGTGHFLYVAVLKKDGAEWRNPGIALVGDRVQIKRFYLDGQKVALDVVQGGPNDAACCPTQNATRRWLFVEGELHESGETITGTLALADIAGIAWRLTAINQDERVPNDVAITLSIDGDRVSGSSGCNTYTGTVNEGDQPGHVVFGPIGGTKKLCPGPAMEWETRYLQALPNMNLFSFLRGGLALGGTVDGEYVLLTFAREDAN